MTPTNITRLSSLLFLSSFMALLIFSGGERVYAQSTHTITINNNCEETIWIGASAAQAIQSVTIDGKAVITLGGWELGQNKTAVVEVPLTWANGRFWARTGCSFNAQNKCDNQMVTVNGVNRIIANCCDTGGCVDSNGDFALDCAQTGLPPATLAELTLVSSGQDSYDVSMVDGGNVSVEIIPDSSTYDCTGNGNCIFTGNLPGKNSSTCSRDSDCFPLFGFGYKWKCDPNLNMCVNPFFCGSPGCTDTGGCAPVGLTQSVLANSTWASSGFAVSESSCSSELRLLNDQNQGSTYVGCFAPQKFCRQSCNADGDCGPPYTFNCGASGFCEDSGGAILGADCDTVVGNTTKNDLWGCTDVNSGSCFSTTSGADPNCCGCPSWAPGFPNGAPMGACVAGNNSLWGTNAEPAVAPFNTASPTSYAFPFDDAIKLFDCQAKEGSVTNYTINFCPNDPDGDSVHSVGDIDSDGDGITNENETFVTVTALTSRDALGAPNDPDGDGVENMFDLDSDNDGLTDIVEARGGELDKDGDGRVDDTADSDGDGLPDAADPDQGGLDLRPPDSDGDRMEDFVDTDSDNEAGTDFEENGGFEADGDGLPDATIDENSDGLLDIFDVQRGGMPLQEQDADGDGIPNQLDVSDSGGSSNCSIAPLGAGGGSMPLYLLIPALILVRRLIRKKV